MSRKPVKGWGGRDAITAVRRQKAFELRKTGLSYKEIGKKIGISGPAAYNHVKKYLNELAKKTEEDANEIIKLELYRMDQMLLGLYQDAQSGKVSAVDRVLKIMERRAKLLGLDAPKKQEITGADGEEIMVSGLGGLLSQINDEE